MQLPNPAPAEQAPRRPPGVAVDPAPALPDTAPEADAAKTLVVLQQPLDRTTAERLVRAFFDAVVSESLADLDALLDENARLRAGSRGRREAVSSAWQRRLRRLDYRELRGQLIYRPSDVEIYLAEDLPYLRPARVLPLRGRDDELIVRVPIVAPSTPTTQLFGEEVIFLLRPTEQGYKIGEVYEDFRLP